LLARAGGIMASQGVDVELLHVLDHEIAFGMVKDATEDGSRERDDWPQIEAKIMDADILVIGTPI
jgi:multimeric flavodoxin WrbA